jgi:HK97 gp10 family phage protein
MNVSLRFEGGQELAAALSELSLRMSKRVLVEALTEGAEEIRRPAASRAPRAPGAPDIADHIVISPVRETETDGAGVKVGPETGEFYYGKFLEYGTRHMGAQPFMRPAFDTGAEPALDVIGKALWRELAAKGVHQRTTSNGPVTEGGRLGGSEGRTGTGLKPRKVKK